MKNSQDKVFTARQMMMIIMITVWAGLLVHTKKQNWAGIVSQLFCYIASCSCATGKELHQQRKLHIHARLQARVASLWPCVNFTLPVTKRYYFCTRTVYQNVLLSSKQVNFWSVRSRKEIFGEFDVCDCKIQHELIFLRGSW